MKVQLKTTVRGVKDVFTFGKYLDEEIGNIAQRDAKYVIWVHEHVSWFPLTDEVVELAYDHLPQERPSFGFDYWLDDDPPY